MSGAFHHGLALGPRNHRSIVKRDSCNSGGFITSPASGAEVDVSNEVSFSWDPSCLSITAADIYLYAPYESSSLVQMFQSVDFTKGSYNTTLKPKWWNSTSSIQLELTILKSGDSIWQSTLPSGPIWTAKNSGSTSGGTTSSTDSNVTKVNNFATKSSGISKGAIAAAVIVPLIAIAIGVALYIKLSRSKVSDRRRTWHEKVDQRMSVISQEWRPSTARGGEAAVRASMYSGSNGANRSSVWSAGAGVAGVGYGLRGVPRTSSTYAVEEEDNSNAPNMTQIRRPGVGLRGPIASTADSNTRVSRVSFAADTRFSRASSGANIDSAFARPRPSGESRRAGVQSRAFHSAYIPPVPSRPSQYIPEDEIVGAGTMSPTQRSGPLDLSVEDIQARMSGVVGYDGRPSIDGLIPALTMMKMSNTSQSDMLYQPQRESLGEGERSTFTAPAISMPEPTHFAYANSGTDDSVVGGKTSWEGPMRMPEPTHFAYASDLVPPEPAKSPIIESMSMSPMAIPTHASGPQAMNPDDLLRQYAAQRRLTSSSSYSGTRSPMSPVNGPGGFVIPPPPMSPVGGATYPLAIAEISAANPTPSGMRQLFTSPPPQDTNPFRKSVFERQATGDNDENGQAF